MKTILFAVLLITLSTCHNNTNATSPQLFKGNAIGTTYTVKLFHDQQLDIDQDLQSIIDIFNSSMSTWQSNSLINRYNAGDTTVVVDQPFYEVFIASQQVYNQTNGYFDPTVGNLVNAYGFGSQSDSHHSYNQQHIDSLIQFVGFNQLDIKPISQNKYKILSNQSGIYLEFNAIAKGTLVDYFARYLDRLNIDNYIIEIGGEVITKGIDIEDQSPWLVGVNNPKQDTTGSTEALMVLELRDKAMAGSGNYRKFYTDSITQQQYVHTVNPITGLATPTQVVGVNVIADSCTLADGFATAFMAMPLDQSIPLIQTLTDIQVLIMHIDNYGKLQYEMSPGFKDYIIY